MRIDAPNMYMKRAAFVLGVFRRFQQLYNHWFVVYSWDGCGQLIKKNDHWKSKRQEQTDWSWNATWRTDRWTRGRMAERKSWLRTTWRWTIRPAPWALSWLNLTFTTAHFRDEHLCRKTPISLTVKKIRTYCLSRSALRINVESSKKHSTKHSTLSLQ